jgi:hypothetical protein
MSYQRERGAAGVGVAREVSCCFGAGVKQAMAAAKTTANPTSIRMVFFMMGISDNSQSAYKKIYLWIKVSASLATSLCQRCAMAFSPAAYRSWTMLSVR